MMASSIIYGALSIRMVTLSMYFYSVDAMARPLGVSSNDY